MNTIWRKNNNNPISKFKTSINGLIIYHNCNSGKQILIITLIYIILALLFIKNFNIKIIFVMFGILIYVFEIINTVVEETIDRISLEYNNHSKKIKDMSGTVMLVYMVLSFILLFIVIINDAFISFK